MSSYNILLKVTGSIAAYKSAYLTSKLVQNGFDVKVVMSDSALKFVGAATFEGLTGNQVYTDSFQNGEMMNHINLVKWADITLVCPATGNTINKLAGGISDTLLTSLFLVHDWKKPYLIAPAMNTNMYNHPATQESMQKLKSWGVTILKTDEGRLACGDIGEGKLLDPDEIYNSIIAKLNERKAPSQKKKIIITSGGTREKIDDVRFFTNLSTGRTASTIAENLFREGHEIIFLYAADSLVPGCLCIKESYVSFDDLNNKLKNWLSETGVDAIIHLAAVSDYSPKLLTVENKSYDLPLNQKLNSNSETISIKMEKNFKILEKLKHYSINKNIKVIGFKLTSNVSDEEKFSAVNKILATNSADYIVANDLSDRNKNHQKNFKIYSKEKYMADCSTSAELSIELEKLILESK